MPKSHRRPRNNSISGLHHNPPTIWGVIVGNQNSHSRQWKCFDRRWIFNDFGSPIDWKDVSIASPTSCDDVAVAACLKRRNSAFPSEIYSKIGEPPGAIFRVCIDFYMHRVGIVCRHCDASISVFNTNPR
jgi:hypothetical protein